MSERQVTGDVLGTPLQVRLRAVGEEHDPFKLAIRGMAIIEEALLSALEDAFIGTYATRKQRFYGRLDLAVGFGILTAASAAWMRELGNLRNRFAHSDKGDLTWKDLEPTQRALPPPAPPRTSDPFAELYMLLALALGLTEAGARAARNRREDVERALMAQANIAPILDALTRLGGLTTPPADASD